MKNTLTAFVLSTSQLVCLAAPATATLSVPTMDCPVCPITVKKALVKVSGVRQAEINFGKRQATVSFDDTQTSAVALTQATKDAGYPSVLLKVAP